MTETRAVYHAIDRTLSSRTRADRVLALCFEGDVSQARRMVIAGEDADGLLSQGVVEYWMARTETGYTYERAKDLLTKASRLFLDAGDDARSLLADLYVGLCYWRQGQAIEAQVMLARCIDQSCDHGVRFMALVSQSVLQTDAARWAQGLTALDAARSIFDFIVSPSWRGKFFQQRGLCYKQAYEQTGRSEFLDKALIEYEAAKDHYERAGNARFEASVLNNIGNLYRIAGHTQRAHRNIDRALALYGRINDRSHLAHAKDTKALILLDEGKYVAAKKYADQSVGLLRNHDLGWVTIPLVTRAKILYRLGQCSSAKKDFEEAVAIAEGSGNSDRAAEIYLEQADTLATYLSTQALAEIFQRINQLSPSRLASVASKILTTTSHPELHSLKDLKCAEMKTEYQMILKALEVEGGSVTRAAKILKKTHGGLTHIIKTRHPDLLKHCRPVVHRRKGVKSTVRERTINS